MGTNPWGFILVTVALLLDPTFADVLVQPGYERLEKPSENPVGQSQSSTNQPTPKSQQNYITQQNPMMQLLQQQHAFEQQSLRQRHLQEQNQLLQLQQQDLRNSGMHQYQNGQQDVVGSVYGMPPLFMPGGLGAFGGSRLFSLGPLGLNSFRLGGGGLGGMGFPLLLSPHQGVPGSKPYDQKSMDDSTHPRPRRDVRDPGESSGRKYRPKNSGVPQNGVASYSSVKSKLDATSQNSKTNEQIVGDDQNDRNKENVGSSILDPLGLVDKTEDLIDGLRSGHLPNPLDALSNGGLRSGLPSLMDKGNTGSSQFEEHVVGQAQQQKYNMMNQQSQQPTPFVGDARRRPYPPFGPPPRPGMFGPPGPYGPYGPYGSFGPPNPYRPSLPPQFLFRSAMQPYPMNNQGGGMAYVGNPITGSPNPGVQQPTVPNLSKISNFNDNQQMTGAQNPGMRENLMTGNTNGVSRQSSSSKTTNSMGQDIVGAPNPGYDQMVGAPNSAGNLYELARVVQPMMGPLLGSMTGGGGWNGGPTSPYNYRNTMMNNFYDQDGGMNSYGYNGGPEGRVPFGINDMYDDGYDRFNQRGDFDRIYDTFVDEGPFGFGGGRPQYMHNHGGYMI